MASLIPRARSRFRDEPKRECPIRAPPSSRASSSSTSFPQRSVDTEALNELAHTDDAAFLSRLAKPFIGLRFGRSLLGCEQRHEAPSTRRGFKNPTSWRLSESPYFIRLLGTLPPLAASWLITCLMSQTFIVAESLVSPV